MPPEPCENPDFSGKNNGVGMVPPRSTLVETLYTFFFCPLFFFPLPEKSERAGTRNKRKSESTLRERIMYSPGISKKIELVGPKRKLPSYFKKKCAHNKKGGGVVTHLYHRNTIAYQWYTILLLPFYYYTLWSLSIIYFIFFQYFFVK